MFKNYGVCEVKVITIDGPSAAGKGTLGSKLSDNLNCFYLDSGLVYRHLGYLVKKSQIDLDNEAVVLEFVSNALQRLDWSELDLELLRNPEISQYASKISVYGLIREYANKFQRRFVAEKDQWVIVDGRDAGTVVFPDAAVKLFVTASPDIRARRRYDQLKDSGKEVALELVEREILQRDLRDQTREIAPLKPAPDAYIIDTSEECVTETVDRVLKYLEKYVLA